MTQVTQTVTSGQATDMMLIARDDNSLAEISVSNISKQLLPGQTTLSLAADVSVPATTDTELTSFQHTIPIPGTYIVSFSVLTTYPTAATFSGIYVSLDGTKQAHTSTQLTKTGTINATVLTTITTMIQTTAANSVFKVHAYGSSAFTFKAPTDSKSSVRIINLV